MKKKFSSKTADAGFLDALLVLAIVHQKYLMILHSKGTKLIAPGTAGVEGEEVLVIEVAKGGPVTKKDLVIFIAAHAKPGL